MPGNSFGDLFRVHTFGESHGPCIGAVVDGLPPGIELDIDRIQLQLNRRRPGQSAISTDRDESDLIQIQSGLFEGKTTGAPLAFIIPNKDQKSADYDALKEIYRPGHADYTTEAKFGIRDHRGGGRSSARTTAPWVAAGAIAEQVLPKELRIVAAVDQVGPLRAALQSISREAVDSATVRCPEKAIAKEMEQLIATAKTEGDSLGGSIYCEATGVPAGWGEPQFHKLSADLAHAMFCINAVKGFELGGGFELASRRGSEAKDEFISEANEIRTKHNLSGGIQGGISNGMPIYFRVAFKPVSTLGLQQETVNREREQVSLEARGRHDPCVVPRAVPIVEAMTAIVLVNHYLKQKTVL